MGQERSRNRRYLDKAEVVQALQEAAANSVDFRPPTVSSKKKGTHVEPIFETYSKVQIIYPEISKTLRERDGGTHLYLKFSQKIIALSQNVWSDLIHMQTLFQTNHSREKRACGRDELGALYRTQLT